MTLDPERLHVIRCYERLPPLPGGMERHIAELTAAQRLLGVRVTEIFNRGQPAGESIQLWRGLELNRLRPSFLRSALFFASAALRHRAFGGERLKVVHVHGDWPAFYFGSLFARRIGADAVAASLHSTTHAPIARYAWALKNCDPIFATGERQSKQLSEVLERPVLHLPSAPADLFFVGRRAPKPSIDVVTVGSLVAVKNLDLFLECAALRRDVRFAIVGSGPEGQPLRQKALRLGLDNVEFRGALTPEEVRSTLLSARLFVNTSLSEGSPTAALEAMACGLPVILTPGNDYAGLVGEGAVGYVTSGWDSSAMVEAIDRMLGSPENLSRSSRAARELAEKHRWLGKAQIVTSAMIEAASRHRGARR